MFDESRGSGIGIKEAAPSGEIFSKGEYDRWFHTLQRVGVTSVLPQAESLGILGFDGKEYPRPEFGQVQDILERNKALVERKRQQGFTKVEIMPLGIYISDAVQRTKEIILEHAREGKIFQAKQNPTDPDVPVQVNMTDPLYVWDEIKTGDQTNKLVYFPKAFTQSHQGKTKEQVITDPTICAVPGWSIGLVEDTKFLPKAGQKTIGGRKQLGNNQSPNQYLQALSQQPYTGETGQTPEEFLIRFAANLDTTNKVSNDWDDASALWLIGAYLPNEGLVPDGYWHRDFQRLYLKRNYPGDRNVSMGIRSTVRLPLKP